MPSSRSRPWFLTFHPGGSKADGDNSGTSRWKTKPLAINSYLPIEIENDSFKGSILLVHDTGNEPVYEEERNDDGDVIETKHRGVQMQLQGRFKVASTTGPGKGVWFGGQLPEGLQLGFFMKSAVGLMTKFAMQKTEGRLNLVLGDKTTQAACTFPIAQVFTIIRTPLSERPPRLGSQELADIKWQGASQIDIDTEHIYTMVYKTPFMDLCTWEVLNVPAVSPLPVERLLGNMITCDVMLYDVGRCGSHADWRKATLLEWHFVLGDFNDKWIDDIGDGAKTPLDAASEGSEASDADGEMLVNEDEDQHSDDSSDSAGSVEEEDDEISMAESVALSGLASWQPRTTITSSPGVSVSIPYYIEAIARRHSRKLRVWFLIKLEGDMDDAFWSARYVSDLKSLCRPRPRLRPAFRRGVMLKCHRYSTFALEQFRTVICSQAQNEHSMLRRALLAEAAADALGSRQSTEEVVDEDVENVSSLAAKAAKLKGAVISVAQRTSTQRSRRSSKEACEQSASGQTNPTERPKRSILPPCFGIVTGSKVQSAFKDAREARDAVVHEGLVAAVHFEGRICEEWLRLSKDGTLRCFMPFDCDKPRLRLTAKQILRVERLPGLFLGRFHRWQVHTFLRVFMFLSANEVDCDQWMSAMSREDQDQTPARNNHTSADAALLLVDTSNPRRWPSKRRLVLNDRLVFSDPVETVPSQLIEGMLERVLALHANPSPEGLIEFMNATCLLKAVRFKGWEQHDLLMFWLNVYHCLLLHGRLVLGTPNSSKELDRFYDRVSYLIGLQPVSLDEIERKILHVPRADRVVASAATGRAHVGNLLSLCLPFSLRSLGDWSVFARGARPLLNTGGGSPQSSNRPSDKNTVVKSPVVARHMVCLPKMHLPSVNRWNKFLQSSQACLYLGHKPESFAVPSLDLRVFLCLNRGDLSSMARIPVFTSQFVNEQLDEVTRAFMAEFVRIEMTTESARTTLPHRCRGLKRELNMNPQRLLKFVSGFMPQGQDSQEELLRSQIVFEKQRQDPRPDAELVRMSYSKEYRTGTSEALENSFASVEAADLSDASPRESVCGWVSI
eukprot:TRINITY_DN3712_c0_g1_i1.p1 TRINITY_DN3712_c0_g1~~TRINITY_DN3712_c0_g1_i1.p1  ORF type:complete len:1070 (+),score=153.13 TRINITY_DN3712_c0_g1_i1:142-3351(+)